MTVKYCIAFLAYFVGNVTLFSLFLCGMVLKFEVAVFAKNYLGYQGGCLFVWYICLCKFWCICFQIAYAYKIFFFYFDASVFWCHCLWSIIFWCICFQTAFVFRFHIRDFNIHMASIHGEGIGFAIFLLLYTKCSGQDFLIARCGNVFLPYLWMCVCFFAALTNSTMLKYWIYMVLWSNEHQSSSTWN